MIPNAPHLRTLRVMLNPPYSDVGRPENRLSLIQGYSLPFWEIKLAAGHANSYAFHEPNPFSGPLEDESFAQPPLKISSDAARYDHRDGNDDCRQPGDLFRLMSPSQKEPLFDNIAAAMDGAPPEIEKRQVQPFSSGPIPTTGWASPTAWAWPPTIYPRIRQRSEPLNILDELFTEIGVEAPNLASRQRGVSAERIIAIIPALGQTMVNPPPPRFRWSMRRRRCLIDASSLKSRMRSAFV